ncbi:MAG: DUF1638 domain-containing protein [Bacillota bacterium]
MIALPVPSLSSDRVAIIVCEAMAGEMRTVAGEKNIPFVMHVINSQCHRDPIILKSKIAEALNLFEDEMGVFVAYGKCSSYAGNDQPIVQGFKDLNCASILLGGDSEYEKLAAGTYFLTPYLALHWKEYFLGKMDDCPLDRKSAKRLEKWFEPIGRVVKINIRPETEEIENLSAREFSSAINKPLFYVPGTLDLLRREYDRLCSKFTETSVRRVRHGG